MAASGETAEDGAEAGVSPPSPARTRGGCLALVAPGDVSEDERRAILGHAHRLLRAGLDGTRGRHEAYRRVGSPCSRCGTPIRAKPQGDDARMAYWFRAPGRKDRASPVEEGVTVRAPHLHRSLRCFALGAFRWLLTEVDAGAEVPFAFEEHGSIGRPALYEYRPLVRGFVEARADRLSRREDAKLALEELTREPAAAIFARAHAGAKPSEERALFASILLPLLVRTAEACGGFDWDDGAYGRAYAELEASLFGDAHAYGAVAPLVGITAGGTQIELGGGIRVRAAATGELAKLWPEAGGLLPADFGREPDRLCVLELERSLEPGATAPPDAPGELSDAVTALRLATAAPIAAGPVLFERLDWRPYGIRPVLPIAATQPAGEPTRLDSFRGSLAAELLARLGAADDDPELGEALDRWELSLFQDGPFRAEQLRESLAALLGGTDGLWAATVRGAVLLGETGRERADLQAGLSGDPDPDAVRRALLETLLHGDRARLVASLDKTILGLRPRPARPVSLARALAS